MSLEHFQVGGVLVVEFTETKMLDEAVINEIAEELNELAIQCEGKRMLIDFGKVEFMSSAMIGKIIYLDKKCKNESIDLKLCCIQKDIMDVFKLMNLTRVLDIHPDRESAMKAFDRI